MPESPLEDDQVDRPDVYVQQCTQLTGTNGRTLDHSYRVFLNRQRRFGDMPTTTTPYTCPAGGTNEISGEHIWKVTPVPIPNTVVKLPEPMVVPKARE